MERWGEDPALVGELRNWLSEAGVIRARVAEGKEEAGAKYRDYFEHSEALAKIPSHRLLALFRARKEEILYLDLDPGKDAEAGHSYADGRVLSGTEALKLGFVDQLGNFEVAVDKAKDIAGLTSANLIEYRRISDLSELFQMFGKSDAKAVKVDLGFDIPKLKAGQPYFLSADYLY